MARHFTHVPTRPWSIDIMRWRAGDIAMWLVKLGFLAALSYAATDIPPSPNKNAVAADKVQSTR